MSWKDYLYFQKGDRVAVILLLILIVISGGVYIVTRSGKPAIKEEVASDSEKEFELFLSNLQDIEEDKDVGPAPIPILPRYPYQKKLKAGETVELNSGDTTALKMIPKIGSGYANRIVKYREALGGYIDISQIKEVWGMDDYLYSDILPYITLEPKNKHLKVNTASFQELNGHPYISYKQAQLIVDIRERKGKISSINRLSLLDEFTDKDIKKLTPYLSFD
jgi:General secretion pathway protein K.